MRSAIAIGEGETCTRRGGPPEPCDGDTGTGIGTPPTGVSFEIPCGGDAAAPEVWRCGIAACSPASAMIPGIVGRRPGGGGGGNGGADSFGVRRADGGP